MFSYLKDFCHFAKIGSQSEAASRIVSVSQINAASSSLM